MKHILEKKFHFQGWNVQTFQFRVFDLPLKMKGGKFLYYFPIKSKFIYFFCVVFISLHCIITLNVNLFFIYSRVNKTMVCVHFSFSGKSYYDVSWFSFFFISTIQPAIIYNFMLDLYIKKRRRFHRCECTKEEIDWKSRSPNELISLKKFHFFFQN
jgi:hypothetical protein